VDWLYQVEVPIPSGSLGFHENLKAVQKWQLEAVNLLCSFCFEREEWRADWPSSSAMAEKAVRRYESRYLELAAKVPEFMVWALLRDGAASRHAIRQANDEVLAAVDGNSMALSRLEALLVMLCGDVRRKPRGLAEAVRGSAVSALDEPIVPRGGGELDHGQEIVFPTVKEIYVEPKYRLVRFSKETLVSDERWWNDQRVDSDLDLMLAAHFASPESTRLPLLVLGHPGAGKSLLTKVLAARLPAISYTTVRVPLRRVTADAPIFRQIQQALDLATNGRVEWHALSEQTADTMRVILLDGLDELLQASEQNRTAFLHEVAEFQLTEATQNRPVAVVVTSRTVVADRVDVPVGIPVVKLDDFDSGQIERWRRAWNRANAASARMGKVRELGADAVAASGDLKGQPLLLLMVALYAADPSLPPIEANMSRATLYQRLLENFARRESAKSLATPGQEPDEMVRDRLRRLSIAALGMFNRGRQDVTDAELGDDLAAFGLTSPGTTRNAEDGRVLVTRFFFIYTAQSLVGNDRTYRSYEFLHATLGEYLVAREVVETLCDTAESIVSRRGLRDPDDDLLFALLSHQCLATRLSILTFAGEMLNELGEQDRAGIMRVLDTMIARCRRRHSSEKYRQYQPASNDTVESIAVYSANLFLLRLFHTGRVALVNIWPPAERDMWRSTLSLWRSGLDTDAWSSMLTVLSREDGEILFQNSSELSANLIEPSLANDVEHMNLLKMGEAIRYNSDYYWKQLDRRFAARTEEELDRWLFQAAFLAIPDIDPKRLRVLLQAVRGHHSYRPKVLGMLLKQRNHLLSYDVIRAIVDALVGPSADPYALMAAIIAQPQLLRDVQGLDKAEIYSQSAGIALLIASAGDKRTRFVELGKLFSEIEMRRDVKENDMTNMARALIDGYQVASSTSRERSGWQ
jgi:hypothetical protein